MEILSIEQSINPETFELMSKLTVLVNIERLQDATQLDSDEIDRIIGAEFRKSMEKFTKK